MLLLSTVCDVSFVLNDGEDPLLPNYDAICVCEAQRRMTPAPTRLQLTRTQNKTFRVAQYAPQ